MRPHEFVKRRALPFLAFAVFLTPASAQTVRSISPQAQSMAPVSELEIVIEFDRAMNQASFNGRSFAVFGRWTGVCSGRFSFEDGDRRVRFVFDTELSAGEWVTVSLSKEIAAADGSHLAKGYAWNFWTSATAGTLLLEKSSTIAVRRGNEGPIRTYGAYAGDLNGDGFHDFTVPNEDASDVRVFMNDGEGLYREFTTYALPEGSLPSTNEGADFNGDGFLDFACGNITGNSVTVFMGDGSGRFVSQTTYPVGRGTRGLVVLDLDGDGATDIVTANRETGNISKLLNNGDGTFAASLNQNTGTDRETAAVAADFNEDGLLDVAVGSYTRGQGNGELVVLLADGNGDLSPASRTAVRGDCWMLAVGDMDRDGHVDVVSANSQQNQFALLRGDGLGGLGQAELYPVGAFPLAIDVGDIDGDGDLEVVTSNFTSGDWTLYENDGSGNFINPRTLLTSAAGSCAVLHDRDRDGDLDMTGIDEIDDLLILFDNPATPSGTPDGPTPSDFKLSQSFPNPFSKTASAGKTITIAFSLERQALVHLDIYNVRGQRVRRLLNASMPKGDHLTNFVPQNLPSGVYFYRLTSHSVSLARKILLFE